MNTNKDQVRGRIKEAKGKIKKVAGKLLGDNSLQAKAKSQSFLDKAQAKFGDVKQRVKQSCKKRCGDFRNELNRLGADAPNNSQRIEKAR
jgi:uncharacterized protein YjbJ (UPF0337 family)